MEKTILYLINGFGIEQKDSYSIYNEKVMPNLEKIRNESLYSTIDNTSLDLLESYRYFSTGAKNELTFAFLDQYSKDFDINGNVKYIFDQMPSDMDIQLFLYLNDTKSFEHLKNFYNYISSRKPNNIYLHIILDSKDVAKYKEFDTIFTKIGYDLKSLPIRTVIGKNKLISDAKGYVQILNNGVGEKWKEIGKKFSSLEASNITPDNAEPFFLQEGFSVKSNSCIFFMNYKSENIVEFMSKLTEFNAIDKYFSMFPLTGIKYPLFAYPTSTLSMVNTLTTLDKKCLMVSEEKKIGYVNYFCNGLKNEVSPYLTHTKFEPHLFKERVYVEKLVKDNKFDLVIINDSIDSIETIDGIEQKMKDIDENIKTLSEVCGEYNFVIASLYGMKKEVHKDNFTKFLVNFSGRSPVIIKSNKYTKQNQMVIPGDIGIFANTIYSTLSPRAQGNTMLRKKGFNLNSIFKK